MLRQTYRAALSALMALGSFTFAVAEEPKATGKNQRSPTRSA